MTVNGMPATGQRRYTAGQPDRRADGRGWPRWAAVGFAAVVSIVAAMLDLELRDSLGLSFTIASAVGCVGAVIAVRRRALFGITLQPPLVLAAAVVLAGFLRQAPNGIAATVIYTGTQLINQFPLMAGVTGACVLVGLFRVWRGRQAG